ncbi:CinA family protein [Pseudomonas sp. ABC1]|uniref:CinA family protein n=1 Tax=Pseudomonas sp. ABC1 TaxID=2748080 RepID=UPI00358E7A3F
MLCRFAGCVTGSRQWIRRRAESEVNGVLDELASELGNLLHQQGLQVTTAESCTGGGIAEAITRIAGSSAWFEAGYVTYSNAQKTRQLGVPAGLFEQVGAVSGEVVKAMAMGAQAASGAYFAVAVSGIAGPGGGTEEKPVGTVWLAWAAGERVFCERHLFPGDRQAVRLATVRVALQGLIGLARGEKATQG